MRLPRRMPWVSLGLIGVNILVTGVNSILSIDIARSLPAGAYGEFSYLMVLFMLATLLSGFGLTSQVVRDVSRFRVTNERAGLRQSVYSLLAVRLVSGALLVLLMVAYGLLRAQALLMLIGLSSCFSLLADFLTGVLRGMERYKSLIVALAVQPLCFLALLALGGARSLGAIVTDFCLSQGAAAAAATALLLGAGLGAPGRGVLSLAYLRSSRRGAILLYVISLLGMLFGSLGTLILGAGSTYDVTGLFSVSLTITQIAPLALAPLVVSLYYPRLCGVLAQAQPQQASELFARFYLPVGLLGIGVTALLLTFPEAVITLLYTATYRDAVPAVVLMAPVALLLMLDILMSWTLIAHQKELLVMAALAARIGLLAIGGLVAIWLGEQRAVAAISLAHLAAVLASLAIQLHGIRRLAIYRLWLGAGLAAAAVAVGVALTGRWLLPFRALGFPYLQAIPGSANILYVVLVYGGLAAFPWYKSILRGLAGRIMLLSGALFRAGR